MGAEAFGSGTRYTKPVSIVSSGRCDPDRIGSAITAVARFGPLPRLPRRRQQRQQRRTGRRAPPARPRIGSTRRTRCWSWTSPHRLGAATDQSGLSSSGSTEATKLANCSRARRCRRSSPRGGGQRHRGGSLRRGMPEPLVKRCASVGGVAGARGRGHRGDGARRDSRGLRAVGCSAGPGARGFAGSAGDVR